jgi:hypothetical protein
MGNPRVPDGSTPPWEGLAGPATANVGDAGLAPVKNPTPKNFEQVDPTKHEARFGRTHSGTRKNTADAGQASFSAQGQSRGISPQKDFGGVSGHGVAKRSKSKTTQASDIVNPSPLT